MEPAVARSPLAWLLSNDCTDKTKKPPFLLMLCTEQPVARSHGAKPKGVDFFFWKQKGSTVIWVQSCGMEGEGLSVCTEVSNIKLNLCTVYVHLCTVYTVYCWLNAMSPWPVVRASISNYFMGGDQGHLWLCESGTLTDFYSFQNSQKGIFCISIICRE